MFMLPIEPQNRQPTSLLVKQCLIFRYSTSNETTPVPEAIDYLNYCMKSTRLALLHLLLNQHPWAVTMPPSSWSLCHHHLCPQVVRISQNETTVHSPCQRKPYWQQRRRGRRPFELELQRMGMANRRIGTPVGSPPALSLLIKFSDWLPVPQPVPLASSYLHPPRFFTPSTLGSNW